MEVKESIEKFVEFVLNNDSLEDLDELIVELDNLALLVSNVDFEFDKKDYPDSPKLDYVEIRRCVEARFPTLSFYNSAEGVESEIGKPTILVGDAIDDLTDIVRDLKEVLWCFKNTSNNDALWHFQTSFRSHWGRHLRELQLYLHKKMW